MTRVERVTRSEAETAEVAATLAGLLRPGDVVGLRGNLGAGKTVFVRGLAAGLGATIPVTSPAFVLMHRYGAPIPLRHFDLYRLAPGIDGVALGLFDELGATVTVIEWVERLATATAPPHLLVEIEILGQRERRLRFDAAGGNYVEVLENLHNLLGAK